MAKLANKASDIVSYKPKPSLCVDASELPSIKGMKIGETCTLTVKAKLVSLDGDDEYHDGESPSNPRARFRITKVSDAK